MKKVVYGILEDALAIGTIGLVAAQTNIMQKALSVVPDKALTPMAIAAATTVITDNAIQNIVKYCGIEGNSFVSSISSGIAFGTGMTMGICAYSFYDSITASDRMPVGIGTQHETDL